MSKNDRLLSKLYSSGQWLRCFGTRMLMYLMYTPLLRCVCSLHLPHRSEFRKKSNKLIPLNVDHAPLLAMIHQECCEKPWDQGFFESLLCEQPTACPVIGWLATKDEHPSGFILARNQITQTEILTFAVRPCFQKQGIGTRLLKHLQHTTSHPLFLEVAIDNQRAIDLYQRQGFTIVGTRPRYYDNVQGSAVDGFVMRCIEKNLNFFS